VVIITTMILFFSIGWVSGVLAACARSTSISRPGIPAP
jgi:hypothetical protein